MLVEMDGTEVPETDGARESVQVAPDFVTEGKSNKASLFSMLGIR
jgi:hypothetical protein